MYQVIDMGNKKQTKQNILNSMRWCNAWSCREFDCPRHPDNIPNRYRNSAFRYVDSSNFEHCKRWENVAARKKQEKEQKNEDNVL